MKRTKVFRPRRGIHFSDDRGARPKGGFIGAPSTDRTRPTPPKKTLHLKKFASVVASGSVNRSVRAPDGFTHFQPNPGSVTPVTLTGSIFVAGSVSYGRKHVKAKYNSILLGLSTNNAIAAAPYSQVADQNLTGTFVSPSWTHKSAGFNQAFVGLALSSSYVETRSLNYFNSGSAPLESSPVPASATLFYSKESRFNRVTVKLTSSQATGLYDDANFGTLVAASASVVSPLKFNFNVPVTGRLTDARVWVEIVMLSGNNAVGSTGSAGHLVWAGLAGGSCYLPMESFGISLRSPNVSWPGQWAHPIMNDPSYQARMLFTASNPDSPYDIGVMIPPDFYRNSYLLWEPGPLFDSDYFSNPGWIAPTEPGVGVGRLRANFANWGRDLGMRTIFSDGSPIVNPRVSIGEQSFWLAANGAPCVTGSWPYLVPGYYQHGNGVPWTGDSGSWGNSNAGLASFVGGSPPAGWLSGPGGAAGANEWPTTGTTWGASTLRPMYPLLDPVYQKYLSDNGKWFAGLGTVASDVYPDKLLWRGSRPGLRDTEISGTWTLMFARAASGSAMNPWMFVRQARLELTYAVNRPGMARFRSRRRSPMPAGDRFWGKISGSDHYHYGDTGNSNQGCFEHGTYTAQQLTAETLFGMFIGTGSVGRDIALEWRLTGTLADISGTGPGWLTNNQFRMPMIPISSASLAPVTSSAAVSAIPTDFLIQSKLLDGPRRLEDVSQDVNPRASLVQIAAEFVSGTNT